MRTPIVLPELGLSPGRTVTLSAWFARIGEIVIEGERVVEVLTDGATFDVASPATGCLVERLVHPRDELHTGQELGIVDSGDAT